MKTIEELYDEVMASEELKKECMEAIKADKDAAVKFFAGFEKHMKGEPQ